MHSKAHPLLVQNPNRAKHVHRYRKSPNPLHPIQEKWGGLKPKCYGAMRLSAEHLAATTTACRQHAATVLGGHALTKAMHLAALTLFGLIGTKHMNTPCSSIKYGACAARNEHAEYHKTTIIVYCCRCPLSSVSSYFFGGGICERICVQSIFS